MHVMIKFKIEIKSRKYVKSQLFLNDQIHIVLEDCVMLKITNSQSLSSIISRCISRSNSISIYCFIFLESKSVVQ